MTGPLYDRAGEVFLAAMELEGEARDAFVAEACETDAELRRMVDLLLAGDRPGTSPLDGGVLPVPDAAGLDSPTAIGPYKILREIGQGGMGKIYLAERADAEFRQQVAVKVVRAGLDSTEILQRFKSERQILANLDHPNIAHLFDGGSLPDGRPYLVMEYVEGERIDVFCDRQKLSVEERLRLFCTVCSAVQVAHQNLVVHRDLKPSNIFVTTEGVPKLLDFGIAKLLEPGRVDFTVAHTRTDEVLLTPEYASPEQVSADAITTASDVYSLGVILYGLLTGHPPYDFKERSPLAVHKAICEEDPSRPSSQVHAGVESGTKTRTAAELAHARGTKPDRLRRRIAGDLDNIVLTALRKEPHRRYASADQLAEDIQRHLKGLPVSARPDTWRYRTSKFFRRNRFAASAAALLVLSLAAFGITTAIQSKNLEQQRSLAEAETVKAEFEAETYEHVVDFMVGLFEGANPVEIGRAQTTARDLLDRGQERIDELADQPAIQARLLDTIGRSYQYLGMNDEAEPLLVRAVELCEELYGPDSFETAIPLHRVAKMRFDAGDLTTALEIYERVLAIHLAHQPGNDERVSESHNNISLPLFELGRREESLEHLKESLRIRERIQPTQHRSLAIINGNLGGQLYGLGRVDEALGHLETAVDHARQVPEDPFVQMSTINQLANYIKEIGRHEEAERLLEKAMEQAVDLWGEESVVYVDLLENLALARKYNGKYAESIELMYQAVDIAREKGQELMLARFLCSLGNDLRAEGEYDEAEELLFEALEIRQRLLPETSSEIAETLSMIAGVYDRRKEFEEAETYMQEALAIMEATGAQTSVRYASVLERAGEHHHRSGDYERALEYHGAALEVRRELYGEANWAVGRSKEQMAFAHRSAGNPEEAERLWLEALEIHEAGYANPAELAYTSAAYGRLLCQDMGRPGDAEPLLRTAYDIRISGPNATERLMSRITLDLAECLMQLDRHAEADQLLTQLQLDFPELANGPENYSQRFRNVERELAERTARPRAASAPGAGD